MPTYEFVCPDGHTFDKFYRKMSAAVAELPCPVCGKMATRKVSGGAGLLFKGSGFYITDYGKDGKKPRNAAQSSESGDKGSDGKSESKSGDSAVAKPSGTESKPAAPSSPKSSSTE